MPQIPDQSIRESALDLGRSFIVQAPAGSGKTELLIQRFLKLLGKVEQPEQIVCMTFTRKAAGEMRDRIFSALTRAAENQCPTELHLQTSWNLAVQVLNQDKLCGWNLLNNPGRLKIQTIDSFCAWIANHMPLKSRIGGSLSPEEFSQGAYKEAARNMLGRMEEDSPTGDDIRLILRHLDNNKLDFLKRIQFLLEKRDQWMIPFFKSLNPTRVHKELFETTLSDLLQEQLMLADSLFPDSLKDRLPALLTYTAENLLQEKPDEPSPLLGIGKFPAPSSSHIPQWRALAQLLVTQTGDFRSKVDKRNGFPTNDNGQKFEFLKILDFLSGQYSLASILNEIQHSPDPSFTEQEWEILMATFNILEPLEKSLRDVFRKREVTDFTEISLSAIDALGEYDRDENLLPTDLAEYLDYRIQHILVDEYQDTSFKQFELLKKLTAGWQPDDGRTLFIVGDPMQSIFRFRDAEVGIFLRSQNSGIGDLPLEKLTLTTNFRSQSALVQWVNQCFSEVFPKVENPDLGEIRYTASQAFQDQLNIPGVLYHSYGEDEFELEARDIADLIQTIFKDHPGKTIAILTRAKRHLHHITRELRHRNILYRAEDIDPLAERWEVQDLLSLLQALIKPLDRIAWLSVLRSPWVGLSMIDIHSLCFDSQGLSIWSLLIEPQRLGTLSSDGKIRAEHFIQIMKPALTLARGTRIRDVLEALWIKLGGPACIPISSRQDIETFFDELERALDSGDEFNLDGFEDRLEFIFSNTASSECPLQLITMHKAKGLEFDFVILPGLGRKTSADKNRLVFWLPHKNSLLLAPIEETGTETSALYKFVKGINAKKDISEASRLLYVASTRAKCQLHLFGHTSTKKNGESSPVKGSPLSLIWAYLQKGWDTRNIIEKENKQSETRPVYPNIINRFATLFELPDKTNPLPTGREITIKETEEPPFEWAGLRARCLGTVLHRCLQTLAEKGFDSDPEMEIKRWEPRINTAFKGMGLTLRDLTWANEQCGQALLATLKDAKGRWVLAQHEEAHNEYALTYANRGIIETRILDRTFVEEGIRWIIDYKTGIHEGGNIDSFLESEKERHRPQLEGYEKALKAFGETRPVKKAIYHPFYQRLLEL